MPKMGRKSKFLQMRVWKNILGVARRIYKWAEHLHSAYGIVTVIAAIVAWVVGVIQNLPWAAMVFWVFATSAAAALLVYFCLLGWEKFVRLSPSAKNRSSADLSGPIAAAKTIPKTDNHTLHDLFEEDFLDDRTHIRPDSFELSTQDGIIKIESNVYLDLKASVKFIGYYIPRFLATQDEELSRTCEKLSDSEIHTTMFSRTKDDFFFDHESDKTSSTELPFSGRVYIYHESDISLEERGRLTTLYKSKGLLVRFRGRKNWLRQQH